MEVENNSAAWLNPSHPNFERWKIARDISKERGKIVESIISKKTKCKDLVILDLGSGEGGTAEILAPKNTVISYDISVIRLRRQDYNSVRKICGTANFLPFKNNSFNLIILQDVIEHLAHHEEIFNNLSLILKKDGLIYLSTPNKLSLLNIVTDPHWGLPFVSLMQREKIKRYVLKYFRKQDYTRNDIAELLSLKKILKLFSSHYMIKLFTSEVVEQLLTGNKGIIWSNFHLKLVKLINNLKLSNVIKRLANNKYGFINKYITPTFYILLSKK